MALVKGGSGTFQLEGTNTYTGGTFINQGSLIVSIYGAGGALPLADDPTKGLVVSSGSFQAYIANSINPGNEVTINANSSVLLSGDNTIKKLTFNNDGSSTAGYLRTFAGNQQNGAGSRGVLTIGVGGLAATSANVASTAYVEGRLDFGANPNVINVAPISAGGFVSTSSTRPYSLDSVAVR